MASGAEGSGGTDKESDNLIHKKNNLHYNTDLRYRSNDIGPYVILVEHLNLNIGRVHPMKLGGMFKELNEVNKEISEISKVGRNRIKIIFKCASAANSVINHKIFAENHLVAYIPKNLTQKQALIRHVDTRISEHELKSIIESDVPILEVKRFEKIVEREGQKIKVPQQKILVTFAGLIIPKYVIINYNRCETETYIKKPIQCKKCLLFGHVFKQCNRNTERCNNCAQNKEDDHACDEKAKYCIYCKTGDHCSTSYKCPYYQKQSSIKKIMTEQNLSFTEAKQISEQPSFANMVKTTNRFSFLTNPAFPANEELNKTSYKNNFPFLASASQRKSYVPTQLKKLESPSQGVPHNHPLHPSKRKKPSSPIEILQTAVREQSFCGPPITNNPFAVSEIEKIKNKLSAAMSQLFNKTNTGNYLEETGKSNINFAIQSVIEEIFANLNEPETTTNL